jgi:hypothetical protein
LDGLPLQTLNSPVEIAVLSSIGQTNRHSILNSVISKLVIRLKIDGDDERVIKTSHNPSCGLSDWLPVSSEALRQPAPAVAAAISI